jgi:hypothetical protein
MKHMGRGGIALSIHKLSTTLTTTLLPGKGFPMPKGQAAGWAQNRREVCGRSRKTFKDTNLDFQVV